MGTRGNPNANWLTSNGRDSSVHPVFKKTRLLAKFKSFRIANNK
jgi:hypothetical protein